MTTTDLATLTISQLNREFVEKRLTPTDALEFCLAKIEVRNPEINAVLEVYRKESMAAANAATERFAKGKPLSLLDGVPIGVKANIAVKGHVCHGGIKAYESNVVLEDAEVVSRLRAAGAVILASLNMEEGALGAQTDNPWFGKTHNPLKPVYTPGGSSGGSAAAVAADMVFAALGTDTMGSVRIPSAYCGLVGYKPSAHTIPMDGIMPLSTTLDTVGPHTKSVRDAGLMFEVMTGQQLIHSDCTEEFAYLEIPDSMAIEPEIKARFEGIIETLKSKSHPSTMRTLNLSNMGYDFGTARRRGLLVSEIEGANYHAAQHKRYPDGFSKHFWSMLEWGAAQSQDKQAAALEFVKTLRSESKKLFENVNYVIAPTTLQSPFKFGDPVPANQADITALANLLGLPAISLPIGESSDGWPISIQIMGPVGRDCELFQTAEALLETLDS